MERPTESTYSSDLKEWINQIIKGEGLLPLLEATVEPIKDKKRTDILIYDHEHNPVLLIEVKRPDIMHSDPNVVSQALGYVESYRSRGLKNYALHNVNLLSLWDLDGKKIGEFKITYVTVLEEYVRKKEEIKEYLRKFLIWYVKFLRGESRRTIDESIIEVLNQYITGIISTTGLIDELSKLYVDDNEFRRHFKLWLADNGWADPKGDKLTLEEYCTNLAKQYLYIFTNKILFYNVLRQRFQLSDFILPTGRLIWKSFYAHLQTYFDLAIELAGNYETVFQTNFVDRIPIPEDTINEIRKMILYLNTLDYSELSYDVIGKVFEKLIPEQERHELGQYFTRSDIVDLILGFCVKAPSSIILDPGCGSGTFLVRAYYRLKYLDGKKTHTDLLNQLWGIDIAKFPAHLSIINLASRDLSQKENYPNMIYGDFFDLAHPKIPVRIGVRTTLDYWLEQSIGNQEVKIPTLSGKVIEKTLPSMDAVVGNPPYTRQEEMLENIFGVDYKEKLRKAVKEDFPEFDISIRASIYAYFFAHGLNFLSGEGKRLGFVSLRSWLDVGYGQELRELFLDNCRVLTIIESKEERWFPEAQMLPCISILEICERKEERNKNWTKFVQLKAPLSSIVPTIQDPREMVEEIYRWEMVDKFVERIENIENVEGFNEVEFLGKKVRIFEDESIRVVMIRQEYLRDDLKWGKYLNAPSAFFTVLERAKDLFVPLSKIASVRRGVSSGSNVFFSLPNKYFDIKEKHGLFVLVDKSGREKFKIEKKYLKPVIRKMKSNREISIASTDSHILVVNEKKRELEEKGREVLNYIKWGEESGLNSSRTCRDRARFRPWYSIPIRDSSPIILPSVYWGRHIVFSNDLEAYTTDSLDEASPYEKKFTKAICAILNSSLTALFMEFGGRYIENRDKTISVTFDVYELERIPTIDPKKLGENLIQKLEEALDRIEKREVRPLFEEVQMDDRRQLDRIVFSDVLGLSDVEIEEIYLALSSLVKARIERLSNLQ